MPCRLASVLCRGPARYVPQDCRLAKYLIFPRGRSARTRSGASHPQVSDIKALDPTQPSPLCFFPHTRALIDTSSLLTDTTHRLGSASGIAGGADIRAHPFFRGVIWDSLRKIRAPFEPKLNSNVDVSYFPIDDIDQADHSAAHRAQTGLLGEEYEAEMSLPFIGYTYKRFDAFRGA